MKIEALEIYNFRGIEHLDLKRLHPNMNIIVGVNGAGKSSILDSISILLSWLLARLKSTSAKGIYPQEKDIRIGAKSPCSLSIVMDDGASWNVCKTRSYSSNRNQTSCKTSFEGMYSLADRILSEGNTGGSIPIIMYYPVERAIASAPVNLHRKKEEAVIWDAYKNALSGNADFRTLFEWYRRQEDIENEIIRDTPSYRDKCLETIRRAIGMFFPDFSEMRVRRRPSQSMVVRKGDETIEFTQLSQGEKCYLSLVCDIARRLAMANPNLEDPLKGEGIILIDEAELHLHPKWQSEIAAKLTSVFVNCQFILSTHSAQVLSDMHKEQIIPIGHGEMLDISFNPYGKLSSSILTNYFDLPQNRQRSQSVAKDVEAAFRSIRDGKTSEFNMLYLKLLPILGANDSDMLNLTIEAKRRGLL